MSTTTVDQWLGMVFIYMDRQERGIVGSQTGSQQNEVLPSMAGNYNGPFAQSPLHLFMMGHLYGLQTLSACLSRERVTSLLHAAYLRGPTSMWEKLGLNFNGGDPGDRW